MRSSFDRKISVCIGKNDEDRLAELMEKEHFSSKSMAIREAINFAYIFSLRKSGLMPIEELKTQEKQIV